MPTALSVQTIQSPTGGAPTMVAFDQANGMEYVNAAQDVALVFMNVSGGAKTLTITQDVTTVGKQESSLVPKVYTIPESATVPFIIPPMESQYFNSSPDNLVDLGVDTATGLTIAAVIISRV